MLSDDSLNAGGKASVLLKLEKNDFPVPTGFIIIDEPKTEDEWRPLLSWWKEKNYCKLAVRSSAQGEDSAENSFAGQFITILQVSSEAELKAAVKKCFQAVLSKNSIEYTNHFAQQSVKMRVYAQQMIQSQFAGVYFSKDPRGIEKNWLVEVVKGQGEQLVSGQVTPVRFSEEKMDFAKEKSDFDKWRQSYLDKVILWGKKTENFLKYPVDMEWAIDADGVFWILQARPITTFSGLTQKRKWIEAEINKINSQYTEDDAWDGQVFSEWTGLPTEMTFDIWKRAFAKGYAFDLALQKVGYKGLPTKLNSKSVSSDEFSLVERIFGRCYININRLLPIYFGVAPYVIELDPRPHLKFSFKKLNLRNLLNAPLGWLRMIKVAWNIQTRRRELAKEALTKIEAYDFCKKSTVELYYHIQSLNLDETKIFLKRSVDLFTTDVLQHTFLLTLLIESTYQGILAILKKDLGDKSANELGQQVLGYGLKTVVLEMQKELSQVKNSEELWKKFQAQYGHRGAGELDLANRRWVEIESNPNQKISMDLTDIDSKSADILHDYIERLSSIRRETLKQEIIQLHFLLQTREEIKMQSMKVYSQIRWSVLKIARSLQFSETDAFWLTLDELFLMCDGKKNMDVSNILERKEKIRSHMSIDLPQSFSFTKLKKILNGEPINNEKVLHGSNLSSGLSQGKVHIVIDPESENLESWDSNTILVAEATDPSWTALFAKSKGIIVSRGGVLSHCAIVAREMGRPAVGEILGATHIFKEGEHVWVDGTHGLVRRDG